MIDRVSKFEIVYYGSLAGDCPVMKFIDSRDSRNQAKIMAYLDLLEKNGPLLPRPYADILVDGIHELRIKLSGEQIRILYFFVYKDFIVLTHCFRKSSDKVPKAEIDKAKKYKKDFIDRFTESDLRRLIKNENI
jgi:phage-related protein